SNVALYWPSRFPVMTPAAVFWTTWALSTTLAGLASWLAYQSVYVIPLDVRAQRSQTRAIVDAVDGGGFFSASAIGASDQPLTVNEPLLNDGLNLGYASAMSSDGNWAAASAPWSDGT